MATAKAMSEKEIQDATGKEMELKVVPPPKRGRVAYADMTEEQRAEYDAKKAAREAEKREQELLKNEAARLARLKKTDSILTITRDHHAALFDVLDEMAKDSGRTIQEIFSESIEFFQPKDARRLALAAKLAAIQEELENLS